MRIKAMVLLLSILLVTVVNHAANGAENLMGTVRAVSPHSITVETMDKVPKLVTVGVLSSTRFIKDGVDASAKDLKVEDRVIISVKPNGAAVKIVFGQMFQHMDMHHK